MRTTSLTPWARGALGPERIQRLRLHLTATELSIGGKSPRGPFVVSLYRALDHHSWERRGVSVAGLWDAICEGLLDFGAPLPPDEEWERLKADVEAIHA